MISASRGGLLTAALALAAGHVHAQKKEPYFRSGYYTSQLDATKDHMDWFFTNGVHLILDNLEVRADSAVVRTDPDDFPATSAAGSSGLPRRGLSPPAARRLTSEALLRQRLGAFLQAAKGDRRPAVGTPG